MMKTDKLKQVKMAVEQRTEIRVAAIEQGLRLFEYYCAALEWFENECGDARDQVYLASPKVGETVSIWLAEASLKKVRALAERHNVNQNRVIYTALVLYSDLHHKKKSPPSRI